MTETADRIRRALRSIVFSRATVPLLVIALTVPLTFFLTAYYFHSFFAGFVSAALLYSGLVMALVILDIAYAFSSTGRVLNRLRRRLVKSRFPPSVRRILGEEFDLRINVTHLKEFLSARGVNAQLVRTVVDDVDECIRVLTYVIDTMDEDPTAKTVIYAVHVTKAEVDEEFNYWRSLKAVAYMELQRELLAKGVQIRRFFITDQEKLTLKALAVIAHHNYWGVESYWGIREKCDLPLIGYASSLLVHVEGRSSFDIAVLVKPSGDGHPYKDRFITYWSLLERPSTSPQAYFSEALRIQLEQAHRKARRMDDDRIDQLLDATQSHFSKGYLKLRNVRRRILQAKEVVAVDLTSVKKSFTVLRQNPGYLEWQDACFRQVLGQGKRVLRRCYLIDPTKYDTLKNFVEILAHYFQRLGNVDVLPAGVYIHYTSIAAVETHIKDMDQKEVKELLETLPHNTRQFHAKRELYEEAAGNYNPFVDDNRALLFSLVRRDYLYTADFIYDYVNPDAEPDKIGENEYSLFEVGGDTEFGDRKEEYRRIYRFLSEECASSKVTNRSDVTKERIEEFLTADYPSTANREGA